MSSPPLHIPRPLAEVLHHHQVDALNFMWRRLVQEGLLRMAIQSRFSTIEQLTLLYHEVYGCILGHFMGLGKSLTTLSFLLLLEAEVQQLVAARGAVVDSGVYCPHIRVLVVCSKSLRLHWQSTIDEWMKPELFGALRLPVYFPSAVCSSALSEILSAYYCDGGILIVGYEEYLRLTKTLGCRGADDRIFPAVRLARVWSVVDGIRRRLPLLPQLSLLEVLECADVVVLDEAHRLRCANSKLVKGLRQHLRHVQLRVALTGTPLQNHLEAYNVMQSVVTGKDLDSHEFQNRFILPIERGQCVDSTYQQFLEMQRCVASLRRYFSTVVHHCGLEELERTLPLRQELIFFFDLSRYQEMIYTRMLIGFAKPGGAAGRISGVLTLQHCASHICLHPSLHSPREEGEEKAVAGEIKPEGGGLDGAGGVDSDGDRASWFEGDCDVEEEGEGEGEDAMACRPVVAAGVDFSESPKLHFAIELIRCIAAAETGEKVVVFSHYVRHLRFLQRILARGGAEPPLFSGAVCAADRQALVARFTNDSDCRVLLCSVSAGGVGINLSAANHCVLLDTGWNPADDAQATCRIYRYGQIRPVTIYRLATYGTAEHVVFSYALRKSWLHRKVVDVTDPTRQERHLKESYFSYPCKIPLLDGVPPEFSAEERRRVFMLQCRRQCPFAARALEAAGASLQGSLHSIVEHSFLLRENEDEMISELGRHLKKLRSQAPKPAMPLFGDETLLSDNDDLPPHAGGGLASASLTELCEKLLVKRASEAAQHSVWYMLQLSTRDGLPSTATAKRAVVAMQRLLYDILHSILLPTHAVSDSTSTPLALTEVFLLLYQEGMRRTWERYLSTAPYLKLRTYLTDLIRKGRGRRSSTMTRGLLEEELLYRPYELLQGVSDIEQAYMATEMYYTRPLVLQCFFEGVHSSLQNNASLNLPADTAHQLWGLLDARGLSASCEEHGGNDQVHQRSPPCLNDLRMLLESCLNELWPSGSGFVRPTLPLCVEKEEGLVQRAYDAADQGAIGLFTMSEVATRLQLQPYHRYQQATRSKFYDCRRCHRACLRRVDDSTLECPLCHYNVEFEIKCDPSCQQRASLYQWSVACNLLDAFSISKSFSVDFRPSECPSARDALCQLRGPHPVFHYVRKCMEEGVNVLLSEFPSKYVQLLSLQCGAGDDRALLRQLLLCGGHMVWTQSLRRHLRDVLARCYRELVQPCSLTALASMPIMCVVLALHHAAQHEGLQAASELLAEDGAEWCGRRALLRFACDGLVKIFYVEKLLEYCREPPRTATGRFFSSSPSPPHHSAPSLVSPPDSTSLPRNSPPLLPSLERAGSDTANGSTASPPLKRLKRRSVSSTCSGDGASSLSSSFGSRYSRDRSSFPNSSTSGELDDTESAISASDLSNEACKTAEQLEGETVLQQRSAQYWIAFCEVYGTRCVQTLNVYVEDEDLGMILLPPPPPHFWVSYLLKASNHGLSLPTVIEAFLTKVLDLSSRVRLVR